MRRTNRQSPLMLARQCPRCRQRSEGVSYLRRPGPLALLIGASVLTYGIGGFVVHGLCRRQRYCPHCGVRWMVPVHVLTEHSLDDAETAEERAEIAELNKESNKIGRWVRFMGFLSPPLALYGVFRTTAGILGGDPGDVLRGLMFTTVTALFFVGSWNGRLRPTAVSKDHAHKVLMLADRRGGILTVGTVAMELEVSLEAAEQLMTAMDDGFRVRSELGGDGVVRYEFPEVLHHKRLERR